MLTLIEDAADEIEAAAEVGCEAQLFLPGLAVVGPVEVEQREFIAVGRDDRAHAGGAVRQAGALEAIAGDIGDGARADIDVHVQEHAVHVEARLARSAEPPPALQSLMRNSY